MDDLSEDDLVRDWSMTPADLVLIATRRGPDHRRRFALQLCMLRVHGRFLDDYRQAPGDDHQPPLVSARIATGIGAPSALTGRQRSGFRRSASAATWAWIGLTRRRKAICAKRLRARALEGRGGDELLTQAEAILRGGRVMLPAISTLERIVGYVVKQTTADLFNKIAARLPEALRVNIDLLVEVPAGDARSSLFRLKDYPKSANASVIKGDIVRLGLIEQLLEAGTGLDDLDPRIRTSGR